MADWVAAILRCEERRRVETDSLLRRAPTCIDARASRGTGTDVGTLRARESVFTLSLIHI